MFDRNVEIIYLSEVQSTKPAISFNDIRNEFMKGVDSVNSQNYNESIIHFNKTLILIKEFGCTDKELISSCYYNLGESYKQSQKYNDAINSFNAALKEKDTNEDAYLGLSDCYFSLETKEGLLKVDDILSKCIQLFPNNQIANFNKGVACFKLNRYSEAYSLFQKANQLGSEEAGMYLLIVKKYL